MTMTLDEAIEHAQSVAETCDNTDCGENHRQLAAWLKDYKKLLSAQPERKTGVWMERLYPAEEHCYCSECKTQWYHDDLYLGGNDFPKYCPECGARMENWKDSGGNDDG